MGAKEEYSADYAQLKKATACIQQFIQSLNIDEDLNGITIADKTITDQDDENRIVLDQLTKITGKLSNIMENHQVVAEVLQGKMKCTHCGATSVGLECHSNGTNGGNVTMNGNSSSSRTSSNGSASASRSSEERRIRTEDEDDEKCSSVGSRIASVDSVDQSLFEQSIRSVSSSVGMPADEEVERDEDIVVKSIMNTANFDDLSNFKTTNDDDPNFFEKIMQQTYLVPKEEPSEQSESSENNQLEVMTLLSSIFGNNVPPEIAMALNNDSSNEASQSPTEQSTLESMNLFESLMNDSINDSMNGFEPSTSDSKSRKVRKTTPMKVPKTENGAGYLCPMEGCNKIFKEKGSVHRHFVTHIGMRFNCDKCKASYTQKHALMLHQKIHANPDAYQCRGCGTNYTTQNGLRLHRQRNPTCAEVNENMVKSPKVSMTSPPPTMVSIP